MLMKYLALLALVASLSSCNTTIGVYRDTKAFVLWTKGKIQGAGSGGDGGGDDTDYGAPVY